jgi:hypothetical protein
MLSLVAMNQNGVVGDVQEDAQCFQDLTSPYLNLALVCRKRSLEVLNAGLRHEVQILE